MAFVVDAISSANTGTTLSTTLTWNHTIQSGTDRLLIVGTVAQGVCSATYGGVAMTQIGFFNGDTILGLINPTVGPASIVVTHGVAERISAGAASGTGAHQTSPYGAFVAMETSGSAPSLNVASAVGDVVIDNLYVFPQGAVPTVTAGSGQSVRWNTVGDTIRASGSTKAGAATVTMTWTISATAFYTIAGVSIRSAPAAVNVAGTSTGTSATSGAVVQGRPIAGSSIGVSITRGWLARYPAEAQIVLFRGGPKRLARSMWRATVDNVRVENITAKVTGASVSMDIDRTIPSTLSVDLIDPAVVRPYSDYLAPSVTITEIVSGTEVTSQLGLYRAGLPSVTRHPKAVVGTVGGEDIVSLLVNSGTGAAPYNLAPGANYMAAAVTQCNLAGVTRVRFPADTRTVPTGKFHSWPPGTARCRIVLDIMLILGYLPPWSDHEGYLVTRVVQDPGTQAPARSYVDGDGSDLTGEVTSDPATTTLANHLIVTYDDIAAGTVLTAERTNTDPTSPASIPNIGERFRHEAMTQAADQAAVNAYADQLVEQWGNVLMHLSLTTPLDPLRGWWESADVAIHAGRDDGGVVGRFRVKGFDHDLSAGTTAVSLRRNEGFGRATG